MKPFFKRAQKQRKLGDTGVVVEIAVNVPTYVHTSVPVEGYLGGLSSSIWRAVGSPKIWVHFDASQMGSELPSLVVTIL
jgi:hypothetical protein